MDTRCHPFLDWLPLSGPFGTMRFACFLIDSKKGDRFAVPHCDCNRSEQARVTAGFAPDSKSIGVSGEDIFFFAERAIGHQARRGRRYLGVEFLPEPVQTRLEGRLKAFAFSTADLANPAILNDSER
jgi:hypothetical protein